MFEIYKYYDCYVKFFKKKNYFAKSHQYALPPISRQEWWL